ncbi:MAG: hypothetical protein ACI4QE_02735, partial [Acutalibacteraceae bacterium]
FDDFSASVIHSSTDIYPTSDHIVIDYSNKKINVCNHSDTDAYAYCDICGVYFTSSGIIDSLGHNPTAIPDIFPSCTQSGWLGGTYCSECGTILTDPQEEPAKGHSDNDGDNYCDMCGQSMGNNNEPQNENFFVRMVNFFKSFIKKLLELFRKMKK